MSNRSLIALALACLVAPSAAQEGSPLTLPEAVAWAVNHNARLAAAAARVDQAEARVSVARAPAQPAFKLTGSGRLQEPVQEISIPVLDRSIAITRSDYATVALGVAWPLWTGGRVAAATGAARAQLSVAEADLQQATEQLIYEVGLAYFRVLSGYSGLADAQSGLAAAEENLRTARVRRQAGTLTGAEVSQAEAAYRRAEQQLAAAANAATDADHALNTLLARPLDEAVAVADVSLTLDCPTEATDAQAVALALRPELAALAGRREAAEQAIAQARAERAPTVAAVGQAAWQTPTDMTEWHSEFFGIEFSWPILNHPASRANERQARASVREADEVRTDLQNAIALQVSESGRRLADAEGAIEAASEAVRAARDADQQAQAAYEAGSATRQQLAAAQTALEQAQARRSQADYARSAAQLSRARALGLLRALVLIPAQEPSE